MSRKELEISIKKNLLDLEYNKYFNLFSTCVILATTIAGITVSARSLENFGFNTQTGKIIFGMGLVSSFISLILATQYRRKYQDCFKRIEFLLDEVKGIR